MSNISFYSYGQLIKNRNNFKITDRVGINRFDTPSALFYKLLFYFSDESGLLGLDGIKMLFRFSQSQKAKEFTKRKFVGNWISAIMSLLKNAL